MTAGGVRVKATGTVGIQDLPATSDLSPEYGVSIAQSRGTDMAEMAAVGTAQGDTKRSQTQDPVLSGGVGSSPTSGAVRNICKRGGYVFSYRAFKE